MKKIVAVVGGALLASWILFTGEKPVAVPDLEMASFDSAEKVDETPLIDTRALDTHTENVYVGRKSPPIEPLTGSELSELKQQATIKQTEIEVLVKEFDQVLRDADQRAIVKAKINLLKAEYNKLVLPIIMQEMKDRSS